MMCTTCTLFVLQNVYSKTRSMRVFNLKKNIYIFDITVNSNDFKVTKRPATLSNEPKG